jgi:hypothetical protein
MFGVRKQEKICLINNKQIQSGEPTDGKDSWIFGAGGSGGATGPTGPPEASKMLENIRRAKKAAALIAAARKR